MFKSYLILILLVVKIQSQCDPTPTILFVGGTGNGKSTISNRLLGRDVFIAGANYEGAGLT
jgi:hypothetical protein